MAQRKVVAPPEVCGWPGGCTTPLAVNNLSKLCRAHRNKVSSRQRVNLVPALARAAGSAGNAIRTSPEKAASLTAALGIARVDGFGTDYRELPGRSMAAKYDLAALGDLELATLRRLVEIEIQSRKPAVADPLVAPENK